MITTRTGGRSSLTVLQARGGVRLGALSNACGEYVRAVLAANLTGQQGITFEVQLGADDVPAAKPAPDGLLACSEALGVEPSR
jgi:beta-phosphoglucomutase-like phosphatase (HAD superfamily)